LFKTALALKNPSMESMHYERAALLSGVYGGDVGQESEEKIGKWAEE
jgi:hypothetical protein